MNLLMRLGVWIRKGILLTLTVACLVAILWGIPYKMFLGFTPLWLDEITIVAVPLALVVTWLIGRPKTTSTAEEKDVKPVRAVPDAAAQIAQDDGPSSPPD